MTVREMSGKVLRTVGHPPVRRGGVDRSATGRERQALRLARLLGRRAGRTMPPDHATAPSSATPFCWPLAPPGRQPQAGRHPTCRMAAVSAALAVRASVISAVLAVRASVISAVLSVTRSAVGAAAEGVLGLSVRKATARRATAGDKGGRGGGEGKEEGVGMVQLTTAGQGVQVAGGRRNSNAAAVPSSPSLPGLGWSQANGLRPFELLPL